MDDTPAGDRAAALNSPLLHMINQRATIEVGVSIEKPLVTRDMN